VIDNGSNDETLKKIEKFRHNKKDITFILLLDPRVVYKQTSRMNAAFKIIEEQFPECEWIFPNDADEFIVFDQNIEHVLAKVPADVNTLYTTRLTYRPHQDYDNYPLPNAPFYEKLHYIHAKISLDYPDELPYCGKSFFRSKNNLHVIQGNHFISKYSPGRASYMNAMSIGLSLREYPLQSVEHTLKKIKNIGIAFQKLRRFSGHGRIYIDDRYDRYLKDGQQAINDIFKESYAPASDKYFIDDKLPIKRAINFAEGIEEDLLTEFNLFVKNMFK
jgi:glycosyltransferase involved in cell wall biosynthesis